MTDERKNQYIGAIIFMRLSAYGHLSNMLDFMRDLKKDGEPVNELLERATVIFDLLNYLDIAIDEYRLSVSKHKPDSD